MIAKEYEKQVELVLKCLPFIYNEKYFAVKGGTALNLFYLNLPRLSVDIDLVYLPLQDRKASFEQIQQGLNNITSRLSKFDNFRIKVNGKETSKLFIYDRETNAEIKIEPNYTVRGNVYPTVFSNGCEEIRNKYKENFPTQLLSWGEIWGGKINAALDRQKPRDLFDINNLFSTTGLTDEIVNSFIVMLMSNNRPIHEILEPNFVMEEDQIRKELEGMTEIPFTYDFAKDIFFQLKETIQNTLSDNQKQFLVDFIELKADLTSLGIPNIDQFPSIKWKLLNLEKLSKLNPDKFLQQSAKLQDLFSERMKLEF